MKFSIPRSAVKFALGMEDSICSLLLLHAKDAKLIDEPSDLKSLRDEIHADALYGQRWLLAYEANVKGWFRFSGSKDYVAQDRNFRFLKRGDVSFYDESKTTLPAVDATGVRVKVVDTYLSRIATGYGFKVEEMLDEENQNEEEETGEY